MSTILLRLWAMSSAASVLSLQQPNQCLNLSTTAASSTSRFSLQVSVSALLGTTIVRVIRSRQINRFSVFRIEYLHISQRSNRFGVLANFPSLSQLQV